MRIAALQASVDGIGLWLQVLHAGPLVARVRKGGMCRHGLPAGVQERGQR